MRAGAGAVDAADADGIAAENSPSIETMTTAPSLARRTAGS
jgi:hypothetical protein